MGLANLSPTHLLMIAELGCMERTEQRYTAYKGLGFWSLCGLSAYGACLREQGLHESAYQARSVGCRMCRMPARTVHDSLRFPKKPLWWPWTGGLGGSPARQ